jgi:uncharacterized membrane protein YvbJ
MVSVINQWLIYGLMLCLKLALREKDRYMKKRILPSMRFIITVFIILGFNIVQAEASEPGEVVSQYFQALKHGDTEIVKSLITDKLYEKRIVLLEKNSNYSTFLKRYYQGATVRVVNVNNIAEKSYVDVEIESQDGSNSPITLILTKDSGHNWKISDEVVSR